MGWERRYLAFGLSQVIIARDSAFHKILNIIPLTAGTYAIKMKGDILVFKTAEREFTFKFDEENEASKWFSTLINLTGRSFKEFVDESSDFREFAGLNKKLK